MDHVLYRFYDRQGSLLYVGMTLDAPQRFRSHRQTRAWWGEVAEIRLEHYPDRVSVRAAERDAIKRERPRYNIRQNSVPGGPTKITWTCQACGKTIRPGAGYIHVNLIEATKAESLIGDGSVSGDRSVDVPDLPELVPWQAHHRACDPEPNAPDYWIDVARWSNSDEALSWAAHLSEKCWLPATDFGVLMRRSGAEA